MKARELHEMLAQVWAHELTADDAFDRLDGQLEQDDPYGRYEWLHVEGNKDDQEADHV
jgi:hypothetical protein